MIFNFNVPYLQTTNVGIEYMKDIKENSGKENWCLRILVTVKSTSRKRNYITGKEIIVSDNNRTMKDLLCDLACQLHDAYISKSIDADIVAALTEEELSDGQESGKVGFGRRYGEGVVSREKAIETMLLVFEDGLFRVFLNNEEVVDINEAINIKDGDNLILVRFVMLSGSCFSYVF